MNSFGQNGQSDEIMVDDDENEVCIICDYMKNSKFFLEDNSHFEEFFKKLKKLETFDSTIDVPLNSYEIIYFHNDKIVGNENTIEKLNGELEYEYENIDMEILLNHLINHKINLIKDINLEIINYNDIIKNMSNQNNLLYTNRKGIIKARKGVIDSIKDLTKLRNENLKLINSMKGNL